MNINKPVVNPNLIEVIHRLKSNNATQEEFYEEFLKANFLCPAEMNFKSSSKDGDRVTVGEGSSINIKYIEDTEGKKFLMAFTDWGELYKWNSSEGQQTLIFGYKDYQAVMDDSKELYSGMVINPFGDNIVITLSMLNGIDNNKQTIFKGEQVMIGIPAEYPTEMVEKLCDYFESDKVVNRAYLLWMVRGKEGSYLLILDSLLEPNILYSKVADICGKLLKGKLLDIVAANSDFGKSAIKEQKPFFKRK